jgi:fructose-1,6-bisphosphatase/sedoheptulose 1,7-bisphosphatase-like protein
MDCVVVIGDGDKQQAPMLFTGSGLGPAGRPSST